MIKRIFALTLFLMVGLLLLTKPVAAQGPTATQAATSVSAASQPSAQDILQKAQKASDDATAANSNANNVVNNANTAVNTVNLLLNFIQAASLFGGILASATAILGARAGANTLNDFRTELTKARAELDDMRGKLKEEMQGVRTQADNAIRAFALMQLGEQQLERRNIKGALNMYEQAYNLDSTNHATNYFLGELYIQDRQLEKGIERLTGILDYAPAEAALGYAMRLKGDMTEDIGQRDRLYAQAEAHLIKALESDPNALDLYGESVQAALGALYKRQGRFQQAIDHYELALHVTPQKSYPILNLAILYYVEGDHPKAIKNFQTTHEIASQMLENDPYDYWARFDTALALLALGQREQAMKDLDIALQQVVEPAPLEIALGEVQRLKRATTPPDGTQDMIDVMQQTLQLLNA